MAPLPGTQLSFADVDDGYAAFVEKFKPKKTTDDCYTPEGVYDAVADWVAAEYGLDRSTFVRPFWPGADYRAADYPDGCCVVDNPPFSILSEICRFYAEHGIDYFLFAPALTCFLRVDGLCAVCAGSSVTYENGAEVRTSFVTSLEPELAARTAPALRDAVKAANDANLKTVRKQVGRYEFPVHVITAARLGWMSAHHTDLRIRRDECAYISTLDAMRAAGKSGIFGSGLLLSERAAAERAAAERWQLSPRELALVEFLSR